MAASHIIFMHVFLALTCFVTVKCAPVPPAFPHVVSLDINHLMLYNIAIKDVSNPRSDDNVRSVLSTILTKHHVKYDKIDTSSVVKTLGNKIKKMLTLVNAKSKEGGKSLRNLFKKWEESTYELNLPHATGTPTKRKLENDLNEERVKRQKLEDDVSNLQAELGQCRENENELKRQVGRLSNPVKRKNGVRGRAKKKLTYSKSEKYRQRSRSIGQIKETVEEMTNTVGFTPVSLTMKDQNGKLINVFFGGEMGKR